MTAIAKAERFIILLKEHGWKGGYKFDYDNDYAEISVTRDAEVLFISWVDNQWICPGKYTFAGVDSRVNRAKDAWRIITGKPDMDLFKRRQRAAARRAKANGQAVVASEQVLELEQPNLPFDIETDDDNTILKACRNGTIVWRNKLTGLVETAWAPREFNRDLQNTFYIGESSTGRPYLSFKDSEGIFRAVAFDQMLQVR